MRIGLEIDRLTGADRTGLTNHILGVLSGLREAGLQRVVTLFLNRQPVTRLQPYAREAVAGFRVSTVGPPPQLAYRLRMGLSRFGRVDVFQYFIGAGQPVLSGRLNAFLIPDLTPIHLPDCHTRQNRDYWAKRYELIAATAGLVLTYSEHTRRDVVATLGLPADRVAAVPLGYGAEFRPLPPDEVATRLRPLGLTSGRYLLTVGTLEPRKNHVTLFRAYERLKATGRADGLPLVVAGGKGWGYEPILAEIDRLGLTDDVRLIGFADDLPALYNGAAALVYPSRYEGFGLPPLEAMACGTAVITSDATSLPEVVGDAGVLVNPDDVDGFTAAMGRVLADTGFRAELAAAGRERADRFTWKACAMGMVAVYRTALCVPMG